MKRFKDLSVVAALLEAVTNDPALSPAHQRVMSKARRRLKALARQRSIDRRDVFHVVRIISETLWDAYRQRGE